MTVPDARDQEPQPSHEPPLMRANAVQRAVRRLAAQPVVSGLLVGVLHHVDARVHRLSGGRTTASSLLSGVPVGMVTTTGNRSGLARPVPLLTIPRRDGLAVVGSNYGQDHDPGWVRNLRADPGAQVTLGGRTWDVRAVEVDGTRRDEVWSALVDVYPGYATYARRAAPRRIAVFVLEPREGDEG